MAHTRGILVAVSVWMSLPKRFVYVLRNTEQPARNYTGLTSDVGARLAAHNEGRCADTSDGRPWVTDVIVAFTDEKRAVAFERCLKSGSGGAFARRHLRLP
jgi:predicted GIY-YIG superfamily endonuclease